MRAILLCGPALLGLAACDGQSDANTAKSDAPGTSLSVNAKDEQGQAVRINADGETGQVSVKLPGFDAKVNLPKVILKDSNFDLDGVKLYPGSTISSVNVVADGQKGESPSHVKIVFFAPAAPATVRDWFAKAFADKGISAQATAQAISGKTRDGDAFTMAFAPGRDQKTTGTITLEGQP